ncbi:replication initiator protein A (plasmid) [Roseivivax marinus]|nr:replication initiator protein A [Roseivivax marinus]UMA67276.1 replication initiator protein A [Roseivivax marinus]
MVGDNTKQRSPLLPDRMQQADFFVCDVFDAAPKGDMASMEHPIFSISTKPDRRIRRYESGSNFVEITPSMKGLATVHDRDVLIYCISQCMAALNEERPVSQTVRFKAYDLLTATNRGTDGRGYEQLRAALERLKGTAITTNIITGDMEVFDGFGLIDAFRIVRETRDGRMQEVEIRLSDWVFNAIQHKEVLTLHRDYFRLRKPLERRIYELARKHCGQKAEWKISLQKLQSKCGSSSTEKEFRRLVQKIAREDQAHGHMPDYAVRLENDMVMFANRRTQEPKPSPPALASIRLDPEAYHDARQVAPGWDIYVLEGEWRSWMAEMDSDPPRNPTKAFVGFCRKWFETRGRP